jgi:DNA-binding GntR family transcriptional regulator
VSEKNEIKTIKNVTLAPLIGRHIQRLILTGEIPVGGKVNELAIARALEVSRGPVREACSQLTSAGFLVSIPQRGSFVRSVSLDEAMDAYEVRIALSNSVGTMAATRARADQRAGLSKLPEAMERANQAQDRAEMSELSEAFHRLVSEATANRTLMETLSTLHVTHRLFRLGVLQRLPARTEWHVAHNKDAIIGRGHVIRAILARDTTAAAAHYRAYIESTRDRSEARYRDAESAARRVAP